MTYYLKEIFTNHYICIFQVNSHMPKLVTILYYKENGCSVQTHKSFKDICEQHQ